MKLPAGLLCGEDGSLFRAVKTDGGYEARIIRENYRVHHIEIKTVADFKASLRAGEFTSIGSYACFFITSDGATLSYAAAREEFRSIAQSIRDGIDDGWRVVGLECMANCDGPIYCDHTGREIE